MSSMRSIYHIARADFLERSRSYNFLIILCLSLYLGYAINMGQIVLRFNTCREIFETALVGVMMAIANGFFLGFFGFYLVKGSINRDARTGIGQIMAATPLRRIDYVLGKWLSHFAVLGLLWAILVVVTGAIQYFRIPNIDQVALVTPFFLVTLPFLALVAALAVLFETIPLLKEGVGNLVYFFLFVMLLMMLTTPSLQRGALLSDPSGIRMLLQEIKTSGLDCGAKSSLIEMGRSLQDIHWTGMQWDSDMLLSRISVLMMALLLIGAASLFFNRFKDIDNYGRGPRRSKRQVEAEVETRRPPAVNGSIHLTQLNPGQTQHVNLLPIISAEVRLMLKGNHWFWYIGAVFLWVATLFASEKVLALWLIFMTLWPLLIWSKMGLRESLYRTQQIVFSCAHPLLRNLLSAWLAGILVTAIMWSGAAIHFGLHDQISNLLALLLATVLVPSLALMLGVWTSTSKVFEVAYLLIWYVGIVSRLPGLDFLGFTSQAVVFQHPLWLLALGLIIILLAILGRKQRLYI